MIPSSSTAPETKINKISTPPNKRMINLKKKTTPKKTTNGNPTSTQASISTAPTGSLSPCPPHQKEIVKKNWYGNTHCGQERTLAITSRKQALLVPSRGYSSFQELWFSFQMSWLKIYVTQNSWVNNWELIPSIHFPSTAASFDWNILTMTLTPAVLVLVFTKPFPTCCHIEDDWF